jgi:hypothetical protein
MSMDASEFGFTTKGTKHTKGRPFDFAQGRQASVSARLWERELAG